MTQPNPAAESRTNTLAILARIIAEDVLLKSAADKEPPDSDRHRHDSQDDDNNLSGMNMGKG